jgi:6-phosphogluconolactonase
MDQTDVARAVAAAFDATARAAIAARGRCACAVPGGSIAPAVFPLLARLDLPWPSVHVFLADERFVAPEDEDSNVRLVREFWQGAASAARLQVHAMPTRDTTPDAAAREAERELVDVLGTPPTLDVAMLGVGPDGHVASLFPGEAPTPGDGRWVAVVADAPKPPPLRLTMTYATLAAARELWVIAFGSSKANAIAEARRSPGCALPLARAIRSGPAVRWFLDDAAEAGA